MKRKTIAVIGNDVDWSIYSGYSFANGLYYKLSEKYDLKIIIPSIGNDYLYKNRIESANTKIEIVRIYPSYRYWSSQYTNTYLQYYPKYEWMMFADQDSVLVDALIAAVGTADVIICNSLYPFNLVYAAFPDRDIIYRQLDISSCVVSDYLKDALSVTLGIPDKIIPVLKEKESTLASFERTAIEKCRYILTLTKGDEECICRKFGTAYDKFIRVPLCLEYAEDFEGFIPAFPDKNSLDCILVSCNGVDIIDLIKKILEISNEFTNITFHFVGSCCDEIPDEELTGNCIKHGIVSEDEKKRLLRMADFALTRPAQKYGMNAKNWDYILYGCTILSNELGVRGYNLEKGKDYFFINYNNLRDDLHEFVKMSPQARQDMALNAYKKSVQELRYEKFLPVLEHALGLKGDINSISTDCFIFGAYSKGYHCYHHITNVPKYRCHGFIDNRTEVHGEKMYGITIYSPDDALRTAASMNAKVIIAVSRIESITQVYTQICGLIRPENIWLFMNDVLMTGDIDWGKLYEEV